MQIQTKPNLLYAAIFPPNYKKELRYYGYIKSFSAQNEKGPFDILPQHENFMTTISGKVTMVDDKGEKREFEVEKAVVEASDNILKVFVAY